MRGHQIQGESNGIACALTLFHVIDENRRVPHRLDITGEEPGFSCTAVKATAWMFVDDKVISAITEEETSLIHMMVKFLLQRIVQP